MLFSTARVLEINEATRHADWLLEGRKIDISTHSSGTARRASQTLLEFTTRQPAAATKLLDTIARLKGVRFLGSGVDFSAYHDTASDDVVKIKRDSAGRPYDELSDTAEEITRDHNTLKQYFGSVAIPQTVKIAEHILGGGYQTVQVIQPYVNIADTATPFVVNSPEVNPETVESLVEKCAGADVALRELCDRSFLHFNNTGSIIDTNGANNVVVDTDGTVSLIDSIPIKPLHEGTQLLVLSQLRSLETSLDEVCV